MNETNIRTILQNLPKRFWEASIDCAKKEADYKNLEEKKKIMLSQAKNQILYDNLGEKMSEAQLERIAYDHDIYKTHIEGLCEARTAYLKAKAKLDTVETCLKCTQSENSRDVAEIKLI